MLRALLLEDNEPDSLLAVRALESVALVSRVATRKQFEAALSAGATLAGDPWDVIILDYSVPGFSGFEALELARQRCPRTGVVILSGVINEETAVQTLTAGASDYVLKDRMARLPSAVQRAYDQMQAALREEQMQAQLQRAHRLENIGALAAGIAHDINNALAYPYAAYPLLRPALKPGKQRILDKAQESIRRCGEMTRQIVTFVRGTDGGEHRLVDIEALVRQLVDLLRAWFPRSMEIRERIESMLPKVLGNETELHQVLLNLCVNARDAVHGVGTLWISAEELELAAYHPFMSLGSAPASGAPVGALADRSLGSAPASGAVVGASPTTLSGRFIRLSIADDGIGMPPAISAKIFEPFFTTKPPGKGSGMGLSNVRTIVTAHHGYVDLSTREGQGSSFFVFLPVPNGDEPSINHQPSTINQLGAGQTLLLVDDDEGILELTSELLESSNYKVLTASSGAEALSIYQSLHQPSTITHQPIFAVLTDLMMPLMDGSTLIRLLRRINPDVKVVCVTGTDASVDAVAAIKPSATLSKPYTPELLLSTLHGL